MLEIVILILLNALQKPSKAFNDCSDKFFQFL